MAGVVQSNFSTKKTLDYSDIEEKIKTSGMINQEQEQCLKNAAQDGETILLNRSLNDLAIQNFITPDSLFDKFFRQSENLSLNFESYSKITDDAIIAFVKHFPGIKKINLKSCIHISDAAVIAIAESCPDLEAIDLSWCDISEKSLFALGHHCKLLKSISVRSCYITDRSVDYLLSSISSLKNLGFAWCKSLTDASITSMTNYCPDAEMIDIRGNEKITADALKNLFQSCHHFSTVHLKRCPHITDDVIRALSYSGERLHRLNLRGCYKEHSIQPSTMKAFFETVPNLASIDLAWHSYINDDLLIHLANYCPNLQKIDLSGAGLLTDKGINYFFEKLEHLEKIILFGQEEISDDVIQKHSRKNIKIY